MHKKGFALPHLAILFPQMPQKGRPGVIQKIIRLAQQKISITIRYGTRNNAELTVDHRVCTSVQSMRAMTISITISAQNTA